MRIACLWSKLRKQPPLILIKTPAITILTNKLSSWDDLIYSLTTMLGSGGTWQQRRLTALGRSLTRLQYLL